MRNLICVLGFLYASSALAVDIPQAVQEAFLSKGGPEKALIHMKCFLENHSESVFNIKPLQGADWIKRCNEIEGSSSGLEITMESLNNVVIVDHTAPSSQRRFFILDLNGTDSDSVKTFYVAHGRYKTNRNNTNPGRNKNTVEWIRYFSNVSGSNTSASGFYITGKEYRGALNGPNDDKNSLILHGISAGVNDNSCQRAIVLHGSTGVRESGSNEGVSRMSSGCMMLDYDWVNEVVDIIRGGGGNFHPDEPVVGGTVIYSYGVNEALDGENLYCTPEGSYRLRL